ncbi:MAG: hypothetical protein KTR31_13910 [Myxococcales bacterium]|nr:hypothetical protein [Myxococcales bacterium]
MATHLLVSPLADGAYFADVDDVVLSEVRAVLGCDGELWERGGMRFVTVAAGSAEMARLSFVLGAFEGDPEAGLKIAALDAGWALPPGLVWGTKYRGKTNELVTQLAINLALAHCTADRSAGTLLCDPMAGRGTTLCWAARYGLDAIGIELDPTALDDFHRHVKRQTKLGRIRHTEERGWVTKKNKDGVGRYVGFAFGEVQLRLVAGDGRRAPDLVGRSRAHVIVADLPYGVQFGGRHRRNPIDDVRACAEAWGDVLCAGGCAVLIFNRLQPRRSRLEEVFAGTALRALPLELPHRMSESIERDVMVLIREG